MSTLVTPVESFWSEKKIPLTQFRAVKRHYNTLKNWVEIGVRSKVNGHVVRLEACYEGSILCSTNEAYERFLKNLNGFTPEED